MTIYNGSTMVKYMDDIKKSNIIMTVISWVLVFFMIAFTFFAFGTSFTFASDEYTEEQSEFISNAEDEIDRNIRIMAVQASATSSYSIDDIYDILNKCKRASGTQYVWAVSDTDAVAALNSILQNLNHTTSTGNTTVGTQLYNIYSLLMDCISSPVASEPTLYNIVSYIETFISSGLFDVNTQSSYLSDIRTQNDNIGNTASNIYNALMYTEPNGNINSTGKYLYDIAYYISPICEMLEMSIEPNVENIANYTEHIDNDIHNIQTWLDDMFNYKIEGTEEIEEVPLLYYITASSNTQLPANPNTASYRDVNTASYPVTPIFQPYIPIEYIDEEGNVDILFRLNSGYTFAEGFLFNQPRIGYISAGPSPDFSQTAKQLSYTSYTYDINEDRTALLMHVHFDTNQYANWDSTAGGIVTDTYKALSYVITISRSNIVFNYNGNQSSTVATLKPVVTVITKTEGTKKSYFEIWRELYGSDDLITAKEAQKPLEQQVLSDFTGQGDASVSLSDATTAKDISGQLKNGLNTDVNASNAFQVFDNNASAFWGWFSSDNASYFTLYDTSNNTNTRHTKALEGELHYDIPDLYTEYNNIVDQYRNGGK